jgi:cytochrome P450
MSTDQLPPLDQALTALFASDPEAMADPWSVWQGLIEREPVHRQGEVVTLVRHRHVKEIIRDQARFSVRYFDRGSLAAKNQEAMTPQQQEAHAAISAFESHYISRKDRDDHTRIRRIAHQAFTPRRIADMQATIERYTDELLDTMVADGQDDLVSGLAYSLPLMVIADMLEVPEGDRDTIHGWSSRLARNRGGTNPEAILDAFAAMEEFREYLAGTIAEHRDQPGETDLIAALLDPSHPEPLTDEELSAMFIILLFSGHETTTNLISIGMLELLRHRDQWQLLVDDPALAPGAVEELLRWVSPVQWLFRVALEEVQFDDTVLPAGQTFFPVLAAANRDPEVFERPNELDITRSDAREHLSLGFGPHFCLGASLTRLEGLVAFQTIARRFPGIHLAGDDVTWTGHANLRSLAELRVALG